MNVICEKPLGLRSADLDAMASMERTSNRRIYPILQLRLHPEIQRLRQYVDSTGVTIGANATIVCGVEIGKYAFIGAGAVVTRNVADYALVVGVPGRQIGWMSRHGYRLKFDDDGNAVCPESGIRYVKRGNMVLEYE